MVQFNEVDFTPSLLDLPRLLGSHLSAEDPKVLVALVLANADTSFVKQHILPLVPYWHFRSGKSVLFFFLGYVPKAIEHKNDSSPLFHSVFRPELFVQSIESLESDTSIRYTGRTMLVLTTAEYVESCPRLNHSWVLDFDLEGLLIEKVVSDVRIVFEDIIRLAKRHPADDAVWLISDGLSENEKNEAYLNVAQKYLPFLKNARELIRAHTRIKVRDRQASADVVE
jgi:hypothetical protein